MKKSNFRNIVLILEIIACFFIFAGCEISDDSNQTAEDKVKEEISYIENKILTFFSMYAKEEYGEKELNWDLIEENVIELNGVLDTVMLDMSEIGVSSDDIIKFKDNVNRLSIATANKDIDTVFGEYDNLYSILPKFAQNAFKNKNEIKQIELKSLVVSSYRYSNILAWTQAKDTINNAEKKYKEMMNDSEYKNEFSYNLNKMYVILSEIKNAIYLEELELTKIKYVNFIEKI